MREVRRVLILLEEIGDVNELNSGIRMVYKRVYFDYCFILKIYFENGLTYYGQFFSDQGKLDLNISSKSKDQIQERLNRLGVLGLLVCLFNQFYNCECLEPSCMQHFDQKTIFEAFSPAINELQSLLLSDSWPRFTRTANYGRFQFCFVEFLLISLYFLDVFGREMYQRFVTSGEFPDAEDENPLDVMEVSILLCFD